jgi:hypothetical protein
MKKHVLVALGLSLPAHSALAQNAVQVTVDNFPRAESDLDFGIPGAATGTRRRDRWAAKVSRAR